MPSQLSKSLHSRLGRENLSWTDFQREDWSELFRLIDLGAAAPRDLAERLLEPLPSNVWPELEEVLGGLIVLQNLVDHPEVPENAMVLSHCESLDQATRQLEERHCTNIDFLLEQDQQTQLDSFIAEISVEKKGFWGQLERSEFAELFMLFDNALGSQHFADLTGFDIERDTYTLTLSLQDLQTNGIGWHRDLYWPQEWVGEDVFAVLYGLEADSPQKGGAFLFYVPWENQLYARYRQKHEATILWNSRDQDGRILHAVSGYHQADTSRHLIILQCLRTRS